MNIVQFPNGKYGIHRRVLREDERGAIVERRSEFLAVGTNDWYSRDSEVGNFCQFETIDAAEDRALDYLDPPQRFTSEGFTIVRNL